MINGGTIIKRFAVVFFILSFFLLWNAPRVFAQFSEAGVEKFKVAVDAPDFTLKELGGRKISLKELRGKVILLNFFATY
jgi:cytochrome oxidase Cu insertion factor (SCO1/SenC/PrrC family)